MQAKNRASLSEEKTNKKIYLISRHCGHAGLMWVYDCILAAIVFAYDKGYIPVVDLKTQFNQYFKDGREFKDNVWEYYFKQPSGLSLENIDKSDFSIIEHNEDNIKPYINILMGNTKKCLQNKKTVSEEKFFEKIELADEIKEYFEKEFDRLVKGEDFLGIICRGTDYVNLRPEGHQIQPEISDVIKKAKEICNKYDCKKIWLATEDMEIYKRFKAEFKDMLIENTQYKFSNIENKYLDEVNVNIQRENHSYSLGKEYLFSMYMLSKSKYLIGGITGALPALWVLSNGFKNQTLTCFWDIGYYKTSKKVTYKNIFERIFSVKNEINESIKHKVFTLFGIRIKFNSITCDTIGFCRL